MSGLSILGNSGECSTGIKFYFTDGSSQTMGVGYGGDSPILFFNSTSNRLANVSSLGTDFLLILRICTETSTCEENRQSGQVNYHVKINSTWKITAFWGVHIRYNVYDCLANFGVYYSTPTSLFSGSSLNGI
jgi:hypothetical protein